MVLTPEQQAEFEKLQAEASKPEPRTETGAVGILHALIDSASGAVAHRGAGEWAALHTQAEALAAKDAPGAETGAYSTEAGGFAG